METKTENKPYPGHTHCYCGGPHKCCACGLPSYDTVPVNMGSK